ncbi:bifunctional DNA primase/polymerase, partial [Methylobacterium soli]
MANLGFLFDAAAHQALSNLAVALDLARAGIAVFPCQPDGDQAKRPYPGVFWRNQSTTNEQRIEQWWERWPDAVPGIDLAKTDFIVIDLDGEGGQADWRNVTADRLVSAPRVETPSGGSHLWFRRNGRDHGNGRGALPPKRDHQGIDVRGFGGYVIAPGATMLDGRRYEADGHDFLSAQSAPDWLWAILDGPVDKGQNAAPAPTLAPEPPRQSTDDRRRAYGEAALAAERERVATCGKGGRNEALNKAAFALGTLVGSGCLGEAQVRAALTDAAQACGLLKDDGPRACQATLTSGLRAGILKPRDVPESGDYAIDVGIGADVAASLLQARAVVEAEDGTLADAETGEVLGAPDLDDELPTSLTRVPGLLGDLTDWICASARRPQRGLALGAALTILGTACGRHLAGPTGSGTHLYVVGLAPTGAGKDHALSQIMAVLSAARMSQFIGPSQFISMPAVINFLVRAPLS